MTVCSRNAHSTFSNLEMMSLVMMLLLKVAGGCMTTVPDGEDDIAVDLVDVDVEDGDDHVDGVRTEYLRNEYL